MIEVIRTREELVEVVRRGTGYLYNDFGGSNPKGCPLHAIGCSQIDRMLRAGDGKLEFKKVWSNSRSELVGWISQNNKVFADCSFCDPV